MNCTCSKQNCSLHNWTDDNILSVYSSDLNLLIGILIEESQTTINWLKVNHCTSKPKKISSNVSIKKKKHHNKGFDHFYQYNRDQTKELRIQLNF